MEPDSDDTRRTFEPDFKNDARESACIRVGGDMEEVALQFISNY